MENGNNPQGIPIPKNNNVEIMILFKSDIFINLISVKLRVPNSIYIK